VGLEFRVLNSLPSGSANTTDGDRWQHDWAPGQRGDIDDDRLNTFGDELTAAKLNSNRMLPPPAQMNRAAP
jgi:hypothetical protein